MPATPLCWQARRHTGARRRPQPPVQPHCATSTAANGRAAGYDTELRRNTRRPQPLAAENGRQTDAAVLTLGS